VIAGGQTELTQLESALVAADVMLHSLRWVLPVLIAPVAAVVLGWGVRGVREGIVGLVGLLAPMR
jgi:hypothetical protein